MCIRDRTYDEATYTTAEGFAEILNEVKRRAEALNYSLIIGAHGCGWTYSSDWVNYPYMARPNAGFAQKGSTSYPTATGNFSGIQSVSYTHLRNLRWRRYRTRRSHSNSCHGRRQKGRSQYEQEIIE